MELKNENWSKLLIEPTVNEAQLRSLQHRVDEEENFRLNDKMVFREQFRNLLTALRDKNEFKQTESVKEKETTFDKRIALI